MTTSAQNGTIALPRHMQPKHLTINRDGGLQVTLQANVVDSETLFFTVPRDSMQQAIDSLHVSDSRGTTPRITFPSASFTATQLKITPEHAWNDLLNEQQGAFVQIHMQDDFAEGHLVGMNNHASGEATKSSLLLLHDSKISAYKLDSITSVSFRNTPAAELSKYTSSREFDLNTRDHYRIQISVSGSGPGQITASYFQTVSGVPFSISYLACKPEGIPAYGIDPNMLLKCFATIPNPLPYALNEVEVTLQGPMYQNFPKKAMYDDRKDDGESDSSSTSSTNSGKPSTADVSSNSCDTSDIDKIFETSSSYFSQASLEAHYDSHRRVVGKTTVSLEEGECARVPLFEAYCEGGLLHFYQRRYKACSLSFYIRNTTGRDLLPGEIVFRAADIESNGTFITAYLKQGSNYVTRFRSATGCRGETTSEFAMENVIKCSKVESKLLATVMFRRTVQYTLHNLEERDMEIYVFHRTRKASRKQFEIEAKWYEDLNPIGGDQRESKCKAVQPRDDGMRGVNDFHVHVHSKEKCRLVVTERITKVVEVPLLQVSVKLIANLEENCMIGSKTVDDLYKMVKIRNAIKLLSTRRRVLRKRFEKLIEDNDTALEGGAQPNAEKTPSEKQQEDCDSQATFAAYTREFSRFEGAMKAIQRIMIETDEKLIHLKHKLKSMKKALTEKPSLS